MTGKSRWGIVILISVSYSVCWYWSGVCILYTRGFMYSSSQLRAWYASPASESTLLASLPKFTLNKTRKLRIQFFNWFLFDYFVSINRHKIPKILLVICPENPWPHCSKDFGSLSGTSIAGTIVEFFRSSKVLICFFILNSNCCYYLSWHTYY